MTVQTKLATVKKHIVRNRAKYAATTTLVVCVTLHRLQVIEMNNFLTEHNLFDKYYETDEV